MTDYDQWLDKDMEEWYGWDDEFTGEGNDYGDDEPVTYPDDYDNYDGWDDMQ